MQGRQHYDSVVPVLRWETACRQELNLISMVKGVRSSDFQRGAREGRITQNETGN